MRLLAGVLLALALPRFSVTVAAEPPRPAAAEGAANSDGNRDRRPPAKEHLREQVIEQWRAMRMWKITDELKLDEVTAAKVFPVLARVDDQERELGKERMEIHRALRDEMANPAPDNAKLSALLDKMLANRARRHVLEDERVKSIRKVLTPVQQAKLILLIPTIDGEFRQKIRDTIERSREGGGEASTAAPGSGDLRRKFERRESRRP
jgi:Spy/CpxP family protein refolding chaperone